MAAFSISSLASFFADEQKPLPRGENHYNSNHVKSFSYSDGIIRGEIHAAWSSISPSNRAYCGNIQPTEQQQNARFTNHLLFLSSERKVQYN